jgi:ABC-type lipoprotein release transport system permease subunit
MNKEFITWLVCITILAGSAIAGVTIYQINERNNFAKNMESAIMKGVDPLSVKCSYEQTPTATCITFSMSKR